MITKFLSSLLLLTLLVSICAGQGKKPVPKKIVAKQGAVMQTVVEKQAVTGPQRVRLVTDSGVMIIRLYDSTPLHRDNFVRLVKERFYDSLLFHRVIPQFMIQGGDPTSKYAARGTLLGNGGDSMQRIPAEFRTSLFHKRGVLAAARDNNPAKASS